MVSAQLCPNLDRPVAGEGEDQLLVDEQAAQDAAHVGVQHFQELPWISFFSHRSPGLVEDIMGLARIKCTVILTSLRPELYDVGSHMKKKTLFKSTKLY